MKLKYACVSCLFDFDEPKVIENICSCCGITERIKFCPKCSSKLIINREEDRKRFERKVLKEEGIKQGERRGSYNSFKENFPLDKK